MLYLFAIRLPRFYEMKNKLNFSAFWFILLVSLLNFSCGEQDKRDKAGRTIDDTPTDSLIIQDNTSILPLWEYDAEADTMIKHDIPKNISVQMVVDEFNTRYDDFVHIDFFRQSQDTVYVKINDASYLTQRMRTTGAQAYLAELTYSMTEVPTVKYVNFDFQEGDHASPGVYQKIDFENKL